MGDVYHIKMLWHASGIEEIQSGVPTYDEKLVQIAIEAPVTGELRAWCDVINEPQANSETSVEDPFLEIILLDILEAKST
ncbi:hypothetical protein N7488_008744 [Penicillium malachiteum]|nr:hypothetical protein N7488_008744 [Penicillium malachiteum]